DAPNSSNNGGGGSSGGASPSAAVFLGVLTGRLPEGAFWEQQRLLRALRRAAAARRGAAAASGVSNDEGVTSWSADELAAALRFLLPFKPADQSARLQATLAAAGAPGGRWEPRAVEAAAAARLVLDNAPPSTAAPSTQTGGASAAGDEAAGSEGVAVGDSGGAADGAAAAKAAELLVDGLLSQHLEEVERHAARALGRLREVLTRHAGGAGGGGGGGAGGAATDGKIGEHEEDEERLWAEVQAALLDGPSRGSSDGGGSTAQAGGSLLVAAAAARSRQAWAAGASGAAGEALPPWLRPAVCSYARRWGARQVAAAAKEGRDGGGGEGCAAAAAELLVSAVRAGVLLLPRSCAVDAAGALQWAGMAPAAGRGRGDGSPGAAAAGPSND
ncbi:hypothetical protein MNEG_14464, partial [Monoraphidium neglectum]